MSIETITTENFTAEISHDETPCNPRTEWDNVGTMIMRGNRYNLGDENHTVAMEECDTWEEVEKEICKEYGRDCIMLPIYIYDHSGITIRTTPFSCRWDSGRVGTIVVSRKKAREEYGMKRITKANLEKVEKYLEGEVETYDQYLTGDVYGYQITKDEDGEEVDSCWGFFGMDYIKEEVQSILKHYQDEYNKKHGVQMELELVA